MIVSRADGTPAYIAFADHVSMAKTRCEAIQNENALNINEATKTKGGKFISAIK